MNNKYGGITGLRGIAACSIAYIFHYLLLFRAMPMENELLVEIMGALGYCLLSASDVFFVMSGFLLARKYENAEIETFKVFMSKRVIKIYPLMIVTAIWAFVEENVGLKMLGEYPLHGDGGQIRYSIPALILNMCGLQTGIFADGDVYATNGPSWFVSVIIICQIVFWLIQRNVKKKRVQNILFIIMITLGVLCIMYPIEIPLLYSCVARGYMAFGIGVLMWRGTHGIYDNKQEYKEYFNEGSAVIVFLIGIILLYQILVAREHVVLNELYVQLIVFWACMVYISINGFMASKVLGFGIFRWLGERSMAVFLCNLPTDIGIALIDKIYDLNLDYTSTKVWLLHIVISLVIVEMVYMCDKALQKYMFHRRDKGQVAL
ncbi:MAG: acyltransferase [Lachnospiraceae bacterium]|nr:acyltransferase [Lachnospiraceae bacterium]